MLRCSNVEMLSRGERWNVEMLRLLRCWNVDKMKCRGDAHDELCMFFVLAVCILRNSHFEIRRRIWCHKLTEHSITARSRIGSDKWSILHHTLIDPSTRFQYLLVQHVQHLSVSTYQHFQYVNSSTLQNSNICDNSAFQHVDMFIISHSRNFDKLTIQKEFNRQHREWSQWNVEILSTSKIYGNIVQIRWKRQGRRMMNFWDVEMLKCSTVNGIWETGFAHCSNMDWSNRALGVCLRRQR